jgi:DNA replication factor GINS
MSTAGQQNRSEMDTGDSAHLALKDVFKLLKKEIEAPALQAIQPDTFQKIAASLGNLKGQGYEGIEAKVRDRMAELLAGGARLLIEARQAKIRTGEEPLDYSKLTDEEKYVLDGNRESEGRMSQVVAATVKGRPKVLESISARMRSKQIVVRFLKPTEAFVGVEMSKYGPFQQEDVASLPFENARAIIEGGAAVEVHVE